MDEVIYIYDDGLEDLTSDTVKEDETRTHHWKKTNHIQMMKKMKTYHYNMIRTAVQKETEKKPKQ